MVCSGAYEAYDWVSAWMIYYCLLWQVSEQRSLLWIPRHMSLDEIEMVHSTPFPYIPFVLSPSHWQRFAASTVGKHKKRFGKCFLCVYTNKAKVNIWFFLPFIWISLDGSEMWKAKPRLFLENFLLVPNNSLLNPYIALGTAGIPWVGIQSST